MQHHYPVGKAQKMVLDALGVSIDTYDGAEAFFERIGIIVTPVRQGRKSIPSIKMRETVGGGFNAYGEGETYEIDYQHVDLTPLQQWMVK